MFCSSCGTRNGTDSNFCKQCGIRLDKSVPVKIDPDDFERALPDEEHVSALLERAYQRRKEGDIEGAISLCVEALHLPIESTSAHSLLGQLYEEQGNREAAIHEYERVLTLNPASIADRVKLDQLRSGDSPHTGRTTRVSLSNDHNSNPFDLSRITAVSVPIVLVLLGGVITLLIMQRNSSNLPGGTQNANGRTHLDIATGTQTNQGISDTGQKPANSGTATTKPAPVSSVATIPTNYPPPKPIYIQVPVPVAPASTPERTVASLRTRSTETGTGKADNGKNRVVLDPDQSDGNLNFTVDEKDMRGSDPNARQRIEVSDPNGKSIPGKTNTTDRKSVV